MMCCRICFLIVILFSYFPNTCKYQQPFVTPSKVTCCGLTLLNTFHVNFEYIFQVISSIGTKRRSFRTSLMGLNNTLYSKIIAEKKNIYIAPRSCQLANKVVQIRLEVDRSIGLADYSSPISDCWNYQLSQKSTPIVFPSRIRCEKGPLSSYGTKAASRGRNKN